MLLFISTQYNSAMCIHSISYGDDAEKRPICKNLMFEYTLPYVEEEELRGTKKKNLKNLYVTCMLLFIYLETLRSYSIQESARSNKFESNTGLRGAL
jgi:hypothetical protein